jgi:hypothetical protein
MMNDELRVTPPQYNWVKCEQFIIHHSSFIIHHSSFITHHSSFIIIK